MRSLDSGERASGVPGFQNPAGFSRIAIAGRYFGRVGGWEGITAEIEALDET